ncbi:MAG: VWA domain-containing protein [Pirellulaceae bacterium]|nr:VWA domain-containing protein [Pirellulaceae bacterium]
MQSNPATLGSETPRHKVPAWALSVVLHVVGVVILGLTLQTTPRGVSEAPSRSVALVLASTSASGRTEYFDQSGQQASDAEATEAAEALPPALPPASAIPDLAVPDLQLPGPAEAAGPAADGLVQTPSLVVSGRPATFPGQVDQAALDAEAARIRARGPSGPVAEVSLFGSARAVGRTFVFVIDRSHSMGGDGLGVLAEAEKELLRALSGLQPAHRFQIIAYHHKPAYFSDEGLIPVTPENLRRVSKFFGGLAAFGATRHDAALLAALREQPDVVFLLTDGGDPGLNSAALQQIRQRAKGRTTIHCLQFGFGPLQERDGFMTRLAADTGGSFGYVQVRAP